MTREEAIEIFTEFLHGRTLTKWNPQDRQAVELAIEALKKQHYETSELLERGLEYAT